MCLPAHRQPAASPFPSPLQHQAIGHRCPGWGRSMVAHLKASHDDANDPQQRPEHRNDPASPPEEIRTHVRHLRGDQGGQHYERHGKAGDRGPRLKGGLPPERVESGLATNHEGASAQNAPEDQLGSYREGVHEFPFALLIGSCSFNLIGVASETIRRFGGGTIFTPSVIAC